MLYVCDLVDFWCGWCSGLFLFLFVFCLVCWLVVVCILCFVGCLLGGFGGVNFGGWRWASLWISFVLEEGGVLSVVSMFFLVFWRGLERDCSWLFSWGLRAVLRFLGDFSFVIFGFFLFCVFFRGCMF